MGVNLSTVNLDGVDPNVAFDPIPAGWYNCVLVGSEMKPTKDQGGMYLELTEQVIDGEFAGRKLFDRLNLQNANPTAMEIAYKTLKAVYNAVGVAKVDDSTQLHGIPHKVKVKLKAATSEYAANNEIQGYDHINSQHATGGPSLPAAAAVGGGAPPWAAGGAQAAPAAAAPAQGAQAAPWAAQGAPAGGPPAFTPPGQQAAPPVQVDPMAGARADGWQAHPQHPGYSWRGNDVVADQELIAHYPAPQAAPPVQQGPPAFTPPAQAAAAGPAAGGWQPPGGQQPWQQPAAQQAPPAQQFAPQGGPAPATAAAGPTPPWAR